LLCRNGWGPHIAHLRLDVFAHAQAIVRSFLGYSTASTSSFSSFFYHVWNCVDMMDESALATSDGTAREIVEDIARRKGTFTDAFRQEAKNQAREGRRGMLQAMESGEEIREDFSKLLKM
jgi:hypothetical protein